MADLLFWEVRLLERRADQWVSDPAIALILRNLPFEELSLIGLLK